MDTTILASFPPPVTPPRPGWALPVQILFGIIAASATVVTLLGNSSVVCAFVRTRSLHTYSNFYIVALALADFIGESATVLLRIQWALGYWPLGNVFCFIQNVAGSYAYHTTYLFIFVISLDRYLSLAYPIRHLTYRTRKTAMIVIVTTCAIPFVMWIPFYFYWEFGYEGDLKRPPNACFPLYLSSIYVTVAVVVVQTWLPMLLMLIVYVKVYRIARNAVSRQTIQNLAREDSPPKSRAVDMDKVNNHTGNGTAASVNEAFESDCERSDSDKSSKTSGLQTFPDSQSGPGDSGASSTLPFSKPRKNREKKALRTLTPIFISIIASGLPWAVSAIFLVACPTCLPAVVSSTAVFLASTCSTMNPFCYAAANPLYRQYFLKIICTKSKREQR